LFIGEKAWKKDHTGSTPWRTIPPYTSSSALGGLFCFAAWDLMIPLAAGWQSKKGISGCLLNQVNPSIPGVMLGFFGLAKLVSAHFRFWGFWGLFRLCLVSDCQLILRA
jgi:hypothetical protein